MTTAAPAALVTGGASGIGLVAVGRLVERGFHVAALDLSEEALAKVEAAHPGKVTAYPVDVSETKAVSDVIDLVEKAHGPLAHVLACAGIARVGLTLEVDRADVDLMMRVNYGGVVNIVYAVLPRMLGRRSGELVVLASATGILAPRKMAGYGASKAAVISFMESLAYDVDGAGVTLAVVCPEAVSTPMAADFFADPEKRKRSMAITPETVVAAMERGVAKKRFLILPGPVSRGTRLATRFAPGLMRQIQRSSRFDLV